MTDGVLRVCSELEFLRASDLLSPFIPTSTYFAEEQTEAQRHCLVLGHTCGSWRKQRGPDCKAILFPVCQWFSNVIPGPVAAWA